MGMDISGRHPTTKAGEYFRANVWSWRPIHALCETVMDAAYPGWAFNDGAGYDTQFQCDILANRLEKYLEDFPQEEISLESDMRVDEKGSFLPRGDPGGRSAYFTDREHVEQFVTFLRGCGGFEIW